VPVEGDAKQHYFPYLVDGKTTEPDIRSRLGFPTSQFDGGRISTYRMKLEDDKAVAVGREVDLEDPRLALWLEAQYSLILVFDQGKVLIRHRFLKVR
jgi:hypothetical protein